MAYEILSESYGRRLPKIAAEADSADDLATLGTNWAEGSTCVIGDKTYSLDKVQGWVEPGSGSGGGGDVFSVTLSTGDWSTWTSDKTYAEIDAAISDNEDILCYWTDGVLKVQMFLMGKNNSGGHDYLEFYGIQFNNIGSTGQTYYVYKWTLTDEDALTLVYEEFTMTPAGT